MLQFRRFLTDAQLVTPEQLAEALLYQQQATPTRLAVLHSAKLLSPEQVLLVLDRQAADQLTVRGACEALGFWKAPFEKHITDAQVEARPTLSHILVDKGWLDPDQIVAALRRFEQTQLANSSAPPTAVRASQNGSSHFNPAFPAQAHESLEGFLELFTDERRQTLEQAIVAMDCEGDTTGQLARSVDTTFGAYHSIKGAARTVGGVLIERLIHQAEEILSFLKQFSAQLSLEKLEAIVGLNLEVLDQVWLLREQLRQVGSEEAVWSDQSSRERYRELLQRLENQLADLESLGLVVNLQDLKAMF